MEKYTIQTPKIPIYLQCHLPHQLILASSSRTLCRQHCLLGVEQSLQNLHRSLEEKETKMNQPDSEEMNILIVCAEKGKQLISQPTHPLHKHHAKEWHHLHLEPPRLPLFQAATILTLIYLKLSRKSQKIQIKIC